MARTLQVAALILALALGATADRPHIVMIVADDLGWNDVGFNNPDMITPNIDSLAKEGVILDQAYVQPLCSPSRSAWMTGVYPFKLGMQHLVARENQAVCLPLDKTLFPQVLQKNGYATHMVGKWHLGFCNWECTPTFRGFDSFYGFYNYGEDYYSKQHLDAYDFRFNQTVEWAAEGEYSTYQFARRSRTIIENHDTEKPLFLYLPFQSVHEPLQVPERFSDMYPDVKLERRKMFAGMVTAMDEAIGEVVTALKEKGIYDNTLIMFTADNGGWTPYGGNNYPLRGGKVSLFEGGTRVVSFLNGPHLANKGSRHTGMIHAVDWFPTFLEAAGIEYTDASQDGVSQWSSLTTGTASARTEFVYNLDDHLMAAQGRAAIRVGDWKLIDGYPGLFQSWYQVDDEDQGLEIHLKSMGKELVESITKALTNRGKADKTETVSKPVKKVCTKEYCPFDQMPDVFDPTKAYLYLFNLKDDPEEKNNLFHEMPEKVKELRAKLKDYHQGYVKPNFPEGHASSDPAFYSGAWSPGWC